MRRIAFAPARGLLVATLASTLSFSCAGSSAPADVSMRVEWGLDDPSATLPADIDQIVVLVLREGEAPEDSIHTRAGLEDDDGDGHPEVVRDQLPVGEPFRITVEGRVGGATRYLGHAGPLVLGYGERRHIDLRMYGVGNDSTTLDAPGFEGRFLHTATALPDGRVLVAGGFTGATPTACDASAPADARCLSLTASDSAYVLDPTTGRFHRIDGGLLEARAGHTATSLPDGRVLLAGGATRATLMAVPQAGAATSWDLSIAPAMDATLASFELFDPEANPEAEDVDRDGDPGRGGVIGAAEAPGTPGRLDLPRFLHSAALVPGTSRVVLAGGVGAMRTYTVFDLARAGGWGVTTPGPLGSDRVLPSAAATGTGASARVWILGGVVSPTDDASLADLWTAGAAGDVLGEVEAASGATSFPQSMASGTETHPQLALWRPSVEVINSGRHVLAVGWLGPLCPEGMVAPFYPDGAATPVRCSFTMSQIRSYTVDAMTGITQPTSVRNPHALGASARLDDGSVVITGGFATLAYDTTNTIDVFTGSVGSGGAAALSDARPLLRTRRALHTTTALPDRGFVTIGGVSFMPTFDGATVLASTEVHYVGR